MKNSEIVLTAYTATIETLSSVPETVAEVELTDEQIDAMADAAESQPVNEVTQRGYDLLEAIHSEEPHFQQVALENQKEERAEAETQTDAGLTTEINRSTTLVNVADTMEGVAALLKRHPYGYKNGSRNSKGQVVIEPYTQSENEAAEQWLASINHRG